MRHRHRSQHVLQLRRERLGAVGRQLSAEAHERKRFWHNIILVKITVVVGLTAVIFLPPEHKDLAGYAVNLLWLWRT